jgi:hypothetical protein
MLKNITQLEAKVGEKLYHLCCDQDSPIEHVKQALFQFTKYIGQVEDAVAATQSKSQPSPVPEVVAPEEPPKE